MKIAFALLGLFTALCGMSHRNSDTAEALYFVGGGLIIGVAAIIYTIENKK